MNTTSILPTWLQYLQALALVAVPCVGTIVAAIGAWIALQQMRVARMKLDHDRYEKRLKIFEAAHALLAEAVVKDAISDALLKRFFVDAIDAPFHFADDVVKYLERLGTIASSVKVGQQALADETDAKLREKLKDDIKNELLWLQQELQSGKLINRFRPYLALDPRDARRR
jgi:hypothetical protein